MSSSFVFDGLRMHLKARGMTYADLAKALRISEATVKRIFATRNCTLARLDSICEVLQVEMAELARGQPRASRLVHQLTRAQEEELMSDGALLAVAACALQGMSVAEILETYRLQEARCLQLLLRLEKIGILELHEGNRIRLRISRTFNWIPDGPMMRFVKSQAPDFFDHAFDAPGEIMRLISVRVSADGQVALLRRIEQLAREYEEQHAADLRLPLEQRKLVSVLLAVRRWEPALFKKLRRDVRG
ncbi:MAG TPA: helix-turn-helix transcriptional regulator [Burkholderiales bacterium]|nr:helix-turn-helix transcriptional regulator [Burkholderiales bacterium]